MTDTSNQPTYTRDQLMQGLRSAHDAGDTDAATMFANKIQQLDAGAGGSPTASPAAGSGAASQPNPPPSFMDQLMPHLAKAMYAPYQQYQAAKDAMTVGVNSYTGGLGSRILGTGTDVDAARSRLGVIPSMIASGAGYSLGPGKFLGPGANTVAGPVADVAGGVVPRVLEGAVAGGGQAAAEGKDIKTGTVFGAGGGLLGVPIGAAANAGIRMIGNLVGARPSLPSADDLENAASNIWDRVTGAKYSPRDTQATARGAQSDASAGGQPMTEVNNPAAHKLFSQFSDYSGDPTSTHSPRELLGWQQKAQALTGDDAKFGKMLSDRIDNQLSTAVPIRAANVPPAAVPNAIQQARDTDALVSQYKQNIQNPPQTALGGLANTVAGHSWGLAHHGTQPMVAPAAEALGLGGLAYEQTGHWLPALGAVAGTLISQPALNLGARSLGNWQRDVSTDAVNRALLGINNPNFRDAFGRIILGGAASGPNP